MNAPKKIQSLRPGCYLMWFKPTQEYNDDNTTACIGTFRVTEHAGELSASSDLYSIRNKSLDRKISECTTTGNISRSVPGARSGKIPIFPLEDYRYYLEVLSIEGPPSQVRLNFRGHRFDKLRRTLVAGSIFQVEMTGTPPKKKGNRAATDYPKKLTGQLIKGTENEGVRGELVLQYLGENLRRAHLRIIRIQPKSKEKILKPGKLLPGKVPGWEKLFHDKIGWQLSVSYHDGTPFIPTAGDKWAPYDLGLAATQLRKELPIKKTTDHDWVYDLLCVPRFEQNRFLGMMFDAEATDLNDRARESAAVAALETVTVGKTKGIAQEMFGGRLYYRTALHEVGHAMNLTHTLIDNGIMNTTDFLLPTPESLRFKSKRNSMKALNDAFEPEFDFSPKDREWLQHAPDIAVRPGGISRNEVGWICECKKDVNVVSLRNEPQAELLVTPVRPEFPCGAPVRLDYTLVNHGPSLIVPSDLSLAQGVLSGRVVGPDRKERYFRSLFRCCDSNWRGGHLEELATGKSMPNNGVTLLRGTDGPLFPLAGNYGIKLELRWDENGRTNRVVGRTSITVTETNSSDPGPDRSAEVALNEPNLMPAIVEGLLDEEGLQALSQTLNSSILAPHYLPIALHCYLHGQARRIDWKKLFKKSMRPLRTAGEAVAGNGHVFASTTRLTTSLPPPLPPSLPPPLTKVESKSLEELFQPEPPLKLGVHSNPGRIENSLDDVSKWLDTVMQITQPPTAAGKETIRLLLAGVGAAVSGKLIVQKDKESIRPKPKRRSHRPLVPEENKK